MKMIVFEGLDGSGKSTLIKNIKKQMQKKGQEVIVIRGLGSSTIGNSIRKTFLTHNDLHNLTRYFLSFANMIQTQEEYIKPNLKTNKIILVDRWLGSNFAYRVYPHRIDKNYYLFNNFSKKFITPDMIIYLKINPKIGLNRKTNLSNHKLDVIESNPLSYFQQVEKGYYTFLQTQKLGTKIILNNMNDKDAKFNQQYIIKKIGEIKDGNNNEEKMPKWKFTYPL